MDVFYKKSIWLEQIQDKNHHNGAQRALFLLRVKAWIAQNHWDRP
jgi:hypothetical protein